MNQRDRLPARRSLVVVTAIATLVSMFGVATAAKPESVGGPPQENVGQPTQEFGVSTLSTRADMVSGGDVLIRIDVPRNVPLQQVQVKVEGRDVSDAFGPDPQGGRSLLGLVDGLAVGENTIEVRSNGNGMGRPSASLTVVNHPITGPVFSGPHQTPFICQTAAFGLGDPLDDDCSATTKVEYLYRTTGGSFEPFDPDGPVPSDLAQTTTTEGDIVDYIVRLETGTINRAVYQIALLHEPGTPLPDPTTETPGWNGRLVYTFGGNCLVGHRQGGSTGGVLDDGLLSPGFAVASSSLNVFGNDCNDIISAESAMMVKEHFIESFGPDLATIGFGCSGGSMQVHLIAQNYPGILDGIVPMCSYPDITTIITPVVDCSLIGRAIDEGTQDWTIEQVSGVTGFATGVGGLGAVETCTLWRAFFSPRWIVAGPTGACSPIIPPELIYDPVTNPGGIRCTIHDNTVNAFGINPDTGFARRQVDNVGVQYGLVAFNDGVISFDHFAELNELAGGYDVDGNLVDERTVADEGLHLAYTTGRVNSGAGGLGDVPIIDVRGYTDNAGFFGVDIHDRFRSFSTRDRLIAANGHADNQVIWIADSSTSIVGRPHNYEAVLLIDEWLAAVRADSGPGTLAEKVVRNKPADAVDTCWTPEGERILDPATFDDPGACNYPSHADPRLVAGAPLANDVLKCQLKRIDPADYSIPLTSEQVDRLEAVFPDGVCDYTRRGVGQRPLAGTWLEY